jgi:hypothetical protein
LPGCVSGYRAYLGDFSDGNVAFPGLEQLGPLLGVNEPLRKGHPKAAEFGLAQQSSAFRSQGQGAERQNTVLVSLNLS